MVSPEAGERSIEFTLRTCALLDSVRALHEARSSSKLRKVLEKHILSIVQDLIPADRGAVLLEEHLSEDLSIDRPLLLRMRTEHTAILERLEGRCVLLAPLLVRSEVAGTVYLESCDPSPPFGESQLLLLTAIARIASVALENAFQLEWLRSEVVRLERDLNDNDEMAGDSQKLRELRDKIARVAPKNTTVLIIGESGTGKELVARSLHRQSIRANNPFVAINCAALTETLLESELFGYEKGAFTGAVAQKQGRLEAGEGGTVFLDEVGEMPLSLQAKLLRVLQNREFQRVGGTRTIPLDIRLIAATHRDLPEAVRQGSFREDLFYRLNVVTLHTPALRDRPEDVITLAHHFAGRFGEKCGRRVNGISPEARNALRNYDWPGNVRELENAIEHAVVLGSSEVILAEDLPESLRDQWAEANPREAGMLQRAVNSAKRAAVKRAYELSKQDHNEAARLLGVHPNYLYRLLHHLNLQPFVKALTSD
ncbi:MAG: sigma 54-interacting transcriptional regulator [Acidobacteriaceae bacterium]|nr:sigma 54-interacting transcriptional regulator [Acidobacteriaceae bacterium]